MSESSSPSAIGEVRSAGQVLRDDVMCQSFIQSSSTLASACLLIRRGQYDLAGHVLRFLEGRKSGRYRDIVFYIQAQIDIELGLFGAVKSRLVQRLREHPAEMVALSLLQACIQAEILADPLPSDYSSTAQAMPDERVEISAVAPQEEAWIPSEFASEPPLSTPFSFEMEVIAPAPLENPPPKSDLQGVFHTPPEEVVASPKPTPIEPKPVKMVVQNNASADVDLMPFQAVIQDGGTKAFLVWDSRGGAIRKEVRDSSLNEIVAQIPMLFPGEISAPVRGLDAGRTTKTCFAFGKLTVTTLHHGNFHCGLITGPLNQSLIAVVRTETLFSKRVSQLAHSGEIDGEA